MITVDLIKYLTPVSGSSRVKGKRQNVHLYCTDRRKRCASLRNKAKRRKKINFPLNADT